MSIKGLDGREFQREASWEKVKAAGYTDTYDGTDCGIRQHTQYITYVIQPGDTLSGIAQRCGTTVTALCRLNSISASCRIYAGNTIKVPEYLLQIR